VADPAPRALRVGVAEGLLPPLNSVEPDVAVFTVSWRVGTINGSKPDRAPPNLAGGARWIPTDPLLRPQ
jgi:hypothetical protein